MVWQSLDETQHKYLLFFFQLSRKICDLKIKKTKDFIKISLQNFHELMEMIK